jgi:hypothetical protein
MKTLTVELPEDVYERAARRATVLRSANRSSTLCVNTVTDRRECSRKSVGTCPPV